jgi:hypothetical protein
MNLGESLNANMAQMNAHLRQMGDGLMQAGNGFYQEVRRFVRAFDEQRGLRYRPATISLSVNIPTIAAPGAQTRLAGAADFRVAQNEDFIVQSVRTFIVQKDLAAARAPTNAALGATLSPKARAEMKAFAARYAIINKDTKVPVMENENLGFATTTPEVGGESLTFSPDIVPGFIIPHNMTVQFLLYLQDNSDPAITCDSTDYCVTMSGVYVSRDAGR